MKEKSKNKKGGLEFVYNHLGFRHIRLLDKHYEIFQCCVCKQDFCEQDFWKSKNDVYLCNECKENIVKGKKSNRLSEFKEKLCELPYLKDMTSQGNI